MRIHRILPDGLAGWALLVLPVSWLAGSVVFLTICPNPEQFQRIGSFGVAVAAILFGAMSSRTDRLRKTLVAARRRVALMKSEGGDLQAQEMLVRGALAATLPRQSASQDPSGQDSGSILETAALKEDLHRRLDERLDDLVIGSHILELGIVVVATLQWGYGDLLVQWIMGEAS